MALHFEEAKATEEQPQADVITSAAPSVSTTFVAGKEEVPVQQEVAKEEPKKETREKTYLDEISYVLTSASIENDGKTFINIGTKVQTELGKMLSWNYPIKGLYTIFGLAGTIRNFSDAISMEGFPVEYMARHKIPKEILDKHVFAQNVKKNKIPNYWALIAYVTAESIRCRKDLQQLMKQNTLDYACVTQARKETVFGTEIVIPSTIKQMVKYVGIVRHLDKMVKDGTIFDNAQVGAFIENCKLAPERDLLEGITLKTITA